MKHCEKWRFSAVDDDETRLFIARYIAVSALAGTAHLITGTDEPRPRVVGWSNCLDGLLVATDKARYIIRDEDEAGLVRLASMLRTEFAAGVVGSC